MTTLQLWIAGTEAVGALLLVVEHYLILHGWGDRVLAWYYGAPAPAPTAHAHWERSWDRRTLLTVCALGLALVLMAAGLWQYSAGVGLAFTGAAEATASFVMQRAIWRAHKLEGQAHE
jgi:hypothetical protein